MRFNPILTFLSRHYVSLMAVMALGVLFFNYHAQGMAGLLPHYRDFKTIILSGLDPTAVPGVTPTFPMWGYGWVFLLTENKLVLLVIQNSLAIFSVWFCFRLIENNKHLPNGVLAWAKLLMIIAVPWYAFHSSIWPHGIANSLIILALPLFVQSLSSKQKTPNTLLISGFLFGLALNFRSDYYLFPIGLALIIGFLTERNKLFFQKSTIWLALIYLTLVPWGLYTKNATGHFLFASTNSGAVLFLGLGGLPGNKWGITPYDGDPEMQRAIESHFGGKKSYVSYEADQFLKRAFLQIILNDPLHFGKKLLHNLKRTVLEGTYQGEFYESPDCHPKCHDRYKTQMNTLFSNLTHFFNIEPRSRWTIPLYLYSGTFARVLVFSSFLLLPLTVIYSIKCQNLLMITFHCAIAYQTTLNMVGNYMDLYSSNMFFFLLINLCLAIYLLLQLINSKTPSRKKLCAE